MTMKPCLSQGGSNFPLWRRMVSNRAIAPLVLSIHVAAVPSVVLATNWILGYQNALTVANQSTWTPIIASQSILLSTYFAFGAGPMRRRVFWFAIGCLALCLSVVVAYSMLSTFPEPKWLTFVYQLRTNSLWVLIPTVISGLLMMLVRPWFGELRHPSDSQSCLQFSLADLFVVMSFVGVATAWFTHVANIPIQASNASRIADVIPLVPLLQLSLWRVGMAMSATWTLFSTRRWIVGLVLLLALIGIQNRDFSPKSIQHVVYTWAVVLLTLTVFRSNGYRLFCGSRVPAIAAAS